MNDLVDVVLTFPDGRLVGPEDLSDWLAAVESEDDIPIEEIELAHAIVARIRQLSN